MATIEEKERKIGSELFRFHYIVGRETKVLVVLLNR